MKTKKMRNATKFQKQVLRLVDAYSTEMGTSEVDLRKAAAWALAEGRFDVAPFDPVKHLAKLMQQASRQEYLEDDNGEPVRRRHAYKIIQGETQLTLWAKIEDITPKKMRLSVASRRRCIQADIFQLQRDLDYYNLKFNPGDPIQPSFNFELDLEEKRLPSEYIDAPPEEGGAD